MILAQRYKELFVSISDGEKSGIYFDIDSIAIEIDTGKIDSDYLNSNFNKYVKEIQLNGKDSEKAISILEELHKTFAMLSVEDQAVAQTIITDIQCGNLVIVDNKTLKDYINEYKLNKENDLINEFAKNIGIDVNSIKAIIIMRPTSANLNEYGRFDEVLKTMDENIAISYISQLEGKEISKPLAKIKAKNLIRDFILKNLK